MAPARPKILRDPWRVRDAILNATAGAPPARPAWRGPHCVIVGDRSETTVIVARAGTTRRDPFLLLDTNLPPTAPVTIFHPMILALLRDLARDEELPAALIAEATHAGLGQALFDIRRSIQGAIAYPSAGNNILPLRTAAMARRIVRGVGLGPIITLDLRPVARDVFARRGRAAERVSDVRADPVLQPAFG